MSLIVLSIPIFFLLIGIELLIERIEHKQLYRLNDSTANISAGIIQQVMGALTLGASLWIYDWIYREASLSHMGVWKVENTTVWWIVLFFGVDLAYYWGHRMSHEINLFWTGHVVHHQSEEYNFSVALRQSTLQRFFTMGFNWPLAFLGFDTTWFIGIATLNTLYQFWIHTELIGKLGPIEWVMNTPSHHRVHHGRNPKYIDRNYAGVFIIWDRLFGTFQVEEERPVYGITTPLETWNPVYAQVAHFGNIWDDLRRVTGITNKLKVLFYKPGWLPPEEGGHRSPPPVSRNNYTKFDTVIPRSMNVYMLVQYVLTLIGAALFLFTKGDKGIAVVRENMYFLGCFIMFTVMVHGLLFEAKKWAFYLEYIRLIITAAIPFFLFGNHPQVWTFGVPIAAIFIGSIFWVSRYQNTIHQPTQQLNQST